MLVHRRVEEHVLRRLVVVADRQAEHVDRVAARLAVAVTAGQLGDVLERLDQVALDDRARRSPTTRQATMSASGQAWWISPAMNVP